MKRWSFFALLFGLLISLQNCKPEKPVVPPDPNDPDSLYIGTPYPITVPFRFPKPDTAITNHLTYEGVELGRRLFYDKKLSSTGQISCGTCHKQEFAFTDGGKALSENVFGLTKRNTQPLFNLLWSNKFFWDGRKTTKANATQDAFHGEQNLIVPDAIEYLKSDSVYVKLFKKAFGRPGDITEEKIYKGIEQFLAALISSNSKFDRVQRGQESFTPSEEDGFQLFLSEMKGDCFHCHTQGNNLLMTDLLFRNNGLDSVTDVNQFADKGRGEVTGNTADYGKFLSPSLRNVEVTMPYMHDGRHNTLVDVVNFYSDSVRVSPTVDAIMLKAPHTDGKRNFSQAEKAALIDFLKTLTDTVFLNNPAFSDPF